MRMLQNLLVIVLSTYVVATLAQETTQDGFDARKCFSEEIARASRIHGYGRTFNGFTTRLLPHEATALAEEDSVVSVFPNTAQTTYNQDNSEAKKLKGKCESMSLLDGPGLVMGLPHLNGKANVSWVTRQLQRLQQVIGAKYFNLDSNHPWSGKLSPVDDEGHGPHTASAIAGIPVQGASVHGIEKGTAGGGAPLSRIAVYEVCWPLTGCSDIDMLAAFDEAVADGVDLISISVGGPSRSF